MGWNLNWPVKKTGVLSRWLKSDIQILTEGIAENQTENGDSNPAPPSNHLHAPVEHVKAYKRLSVLVKRKENIDKTLNFVSLKLAREMFTPVYNCPFTQLD